MIVLYTAGTPNGRKASIMLEECGLAYNVHPISFSEREQKAPAFLAINPNGRIPAIVDGEVSVFESGAILIYLAEKAGMFLPASGQSRASALSWLMWQMGGLGPMAGQAYHFNSLENGDEYAIRRFGDEVLRLFTVMEGQLERHAYLAGDDYTIADISSYAWTLAAIDIAKAQPGNQRQFSAIRRWLEKVGARSPVQRGMQVPG
ncbi:MAG: glutathione S-transferase N-terminal domain-containing protein [Pseudomonadota bacterium]